MECLNTFHVLKYALCIQLLEERRKGDGEGKEGGRDWVTFNKCDRTIKYPI